MSEFIQSLVKQQTTALVVVDTTKIVQFMNPAAELLLDISFKRAVLEPFSTLIGGNPVMDDAIDRVVATRESVTVREALLCPQPQNPKILVDCTMCAISDDIAVDKFVLVELWSVDTLVKMARESWMDDYQSVTNSMIRGLAHEIKNPLGGLRGAAQLLERELETNDLREFTQIIIREADRLSALVDRMQAPWTKITHERLNPHEILEHVHRLVQAETGGSLTILRDYDPSLPDIVGERNGLIQVFLNIVRNACQATGNHGKICLRSRVGRNVSIGGHLFRHALVIHVEDSGPGVPDELQDKIFFPLVTGRAEGTGLGLSVAHEIVARHKGRIEYERSNNTTRFIVTLPIESIDE